jgi:class 3 adenylate cyclase
MSGPKQRPLAKIRHDLRTPINHIIGFSEMLLEEASGKVPDSFVRDLQKIRSGGDRLLALINEHLREETFPAEKPNLHQLCHELRTPVNHIIGYTELLIEQCQDIQQTAFESDLNKINAAARIWLELMERELIGEAVLRSGAAAVRSEHSETEMFLASEEKRVRETRTTLPPATGRVLLADDDASNRELLRRRLEKLGYEVTTAGDGIEALQLVQSGHFDLVLLDLLMPGLDGRAVLARIKESPTLRDLPVIMISALDQVDNIVDCIELGAEDYIAKPFNPVFLRARVGAGIEKKRWRDREVSYLRQIQEEKQRSENLLHIILPRDVADELKATNLVKARRFENVGVLFCDIVDFTAYCDQHSPEEVLPQLQTVVEAFEKSAAAHGLEKIKTNGDSFMGTAGLRLSVTNPALDCVRCGLDMIAAVARLTPFWQVRVGVHVGPVIAGVVGHRKYQYDVWGDTVNLAARLEGAAEVGTVCVTAETCARLEGCCQTRSLGRLEIKGKGLLDLHCIK